MTTATAAAEREEKKGNSLGAIWETRKGEKTYLTGDVMGVKVVMVTNPRKRAEDDTQPRFLIYPLPDKADTPQDGKTDGKRGYDEPGAADTSHVTGTIEAVSKRDNAPKGVKIDGEWYKITRKTRIAAERIQAGMKVNLHFFQSENGKLANTIFPVEGQQG